MLTRGSNLLRIFLSNACRDNFIARGRLWIQTFNEDSDLHSSCVNILLNPTFLRFLWTYFKEIIASSWIKNYRIKINPEIKSEFQISSWVRIKIIISLSPKIKK